MMEMDENRKKVIEGARWRNLKSEFENLKTYIEKLEWWDINVPKPIQNHTDPNDPSHRIITNNYPVNFQYSGIGAPEVENYVASVFFYTKEITSCHTSTSKEYISIQPTPNNIEQQKQFWDWFTQKIELKSLDYWIEYYKKELKVEKVHQPEVIEKLKKRLKNLYDKNLGLQIKSDERNQFFEMGRNYGIYNDAKYLRIGNPELDFTTISSNVKDMIEGYELALKEIALDKVINNINDLPSHDKIKWLGTPSQFSYIFLELVKKGYIDQPLYRSDTSPSRFAELCFNHFEIKTTIDSLKTEFKTDSSLREVNRAKFTIPEKNDVTDKRSGTKNKKTLK